MDLRMTENDVMAHGLLVSRMLLGARAAAFGRVLAQAPPGAPPSPAASPVGTPAASAAQGSDTSAAPTQSPAPPSPGAPTATPTSAPAASPAPAAPAAPSADMLKKARMAVSRPETKNGTTMYCQETANIGT